MSDDDLCGSTNTASGEPCQNKAGSCPWHGVQRPPDNGRPSKFEDKKDDVLEFAEKPIKAEYVARRAGIDESTLYAWLNKHNDFCKSFYDARSRAATRLAEQGLKDPEVDTQMAKFLLERSFGHIKTERREHTGESGGGIEIILDDE